MSLRQYPDFPSGSCDQVAITCRTAENLRGAAGRANETELRANCRGLTRAIGAEEAEHLAGSDCQAQVIDGDDVAQRISQAVEAGSEIGSGAHRPRWYSGHGKPFGVGQLSADPTSRRTNTECTPHRALRARPGPLQAALSRLVTAHQAEDSDTW
jgi:hypothetical protein